MEVRKLLNKHLRVGVEPHEWGFLDDRGHVADLLSCRDADLDEEVLAVVSVVRSLRMYFGKGAPAGSSEPDRTVPVSGRGSADVGERSAAYALALSENVAAQADRDSRTAAFRNSHLHGKLIHLDEVDEWITARTHEQPSEVRLARVRVPEGWEHGDPLPSAHVAVFAEQLAYVAPRFDHVRRVVVAPDGVLGQLHRLATGLAAAHGWEPAQAASWVLTGVTPLIALIRIADGTANIRDRRWTAWSERITLDVHPAATPDEVSDAYRAARRRLDYNRTDGQYRARS